MKKIVSVFLVILAWTNTAHAEVTTQLKKVELDNEGKKNDVAEVEEVSFVTEQVELSAVIASKNSPNNAEISLKITNNGMHDIETYIALGEPLCSIMLMDGDKIVEPNRIGKYWSNVKYQGQSGYFVIVRSEKSFKSKIPVSKFFDLQPNKSYRVKLKTKGFLVEGSKNSLFIETDFLDFGTGPNEKEQEERKEEKSNDDLD